MVINRQNTNTNPPMGKQAFKVNVTDEFDRDLSFTADVS